MPKGWIRWVLMAVLALPLAAFFGFVGYYKAFAPIEELARHSAFTVHLPVLLGKALGWLEMAGALALLAGLAIRAARPVQGAFAWALAAEQVVSSIIHLQHDEAAMLPQNGVIIVMLVVIALLGREKRKEAE
jgi:uncharacterized membrane protein YphA (DoxX/SURF4 family)